VTNTNTTTERYVSKVEQVPAQAGQAVDKAADAVTTAPAQTAPPATPDATEPTDTQPAPEPQS